MRQNQLPGDGVEIVSEASGNVSPEPASSSSPPESSGVGSELKVDKPSLENAVDGTPRPVSPLVIEYCPDCTFPRDYCEFGGKWDVCRARAMASEYAECYTYYLQITGNSGASDAATPQASPEAPTGSEGKARSSTEPKSQQAPGSKKKQAVAAAPVVSIQRVSRAKHKTATVLTGLDKFGVKLDAAAKIFKKQFACGASMVKGLPGQSDVVEIQGDFEEEVVGVIRQNFPEIPDASIIRLKAK